MGSDCISSWSLLIFLLYRFLTFFFFFFFFTHFLTTVPSSLHLVNSCWECKLCEINSSYSFHWLFIPLCILKLCTKNFDTEIWTASSEFGTYRICEQRRFRLTCASAQSRQNLRCSLIQAVSQEEPSDRKPDPRPLWMAGHAQLNFVMTECSKTQIRLTGLM